MKSSSHDILCIDEVPTEKTKICNEGIADTSQRNGHTHKERKKMKSVYFYHNNIIAKYQCIYFLSILVLPCKLILSNQGEITLRKNDSYMSYLKFVTQTERMPASAAARHATGTTSETCFLKSLQSYSKQKLKSQYHFFFLLEGPQSYDGFPSI